MRIRRRGSSSGKGRVARQAVGLAVEVPQPERPVHELVALDVGVLAAARAAPLLGEHQNRLGGGVDPRVGSLSQLPQAVRREMLPSSQRMVVL